MRTILTSLIISGIIIFIIGMYFIVIKAGIPYQDPTIELNIRYSAYYEAGNICMKTGMGIIISGIIGRIILKYILKSGV